MGENQIAGKWFLPMFAGYVNDAKMMQGEMLCNIPDIVIIGVENRSLWTYMRLSD